MFGTVPRHPKRKDLNRNFDIGITICGSITLVLGNSPGASGPGSSPC
jgi:hypothetical protein